MTPFLRLFVSLSLTVLVWGPNAIDQLGGGTVNLADLAVRFVVTFAFFRVSVRGVSHLIDSYRSPVLKSIEVVPAAPPSPAQTGERRTNRRGTVAEPGPMTEREVPGLAESAGLPGR